MFWLLAISFTIMVYPVNVVAVGRFVPSLLVNLTLYVSAFPTTLSFSIITPDKSIVAVVGLTILDMYG